MQSWWMQAGPTGATLQQRDVATPEAGPGQLLVRVRAASLNRGEFLAGHNASGSASGSAAGGAWKAVGNECAGEVTACGAGVTTFAPGDAVMGRCAGAFAEYALMASAEAMAKPAALGWEQAASIPLTYLVAFDMLVQQGRLAAGEWLLVTGISSGVGVASLQLAKVLGARVIGTSGSRPKLQALAAHGLDVALHTRAPDFHDAVMQATGGRGVDLAVNTVGGSVFAECLRALAFQGRLATVGHVDGVLSAPLDLDALHARRLTLFGVSNKLRTPAQRAANIAPFVSQVMPHFASGRIAPHVDSVMDFDQLPEAKARMEAGGHVGKIVLRAPA